MSDLNKLLVHVPSSLCDDFRAKYIVDGANRDKSYDSKVVFLEDTKEIFTKGKIYGSNIEDFKALKELVGTIPKGATSTNIVDYINEKINKANHIHSVSEGTNEAYINVSTSSDGKAVTVSSTGDLKTAVNNANSALQTVEVLGKQLSKNGTNRVSIKDAAKELTTYFDVAGAASTVKTEIIGQPSDSYKGFLKIDVDNPSYTYTLWAVRNYADYVGAYIIGSPDIDSYNSYTICGTRKYVETVEKKIPIISSGYVETVEKKIPIISSGNGINISTYTGDDGKTTYTISTPQTVFKYKGNKTKITELTSFYNTTGDVWSVGPANSKGSTLYAWDGNEWINLGSASGVSDVNTTSSYGICLTNSYGVVGLKVTKGVVVSDNSSVVTGGQVHSAVENAKISCNTNTTSTVKSYINALGGDKSSENGTYINVQVTTSKGEVSGVTVKEEAPLTEAIDKANSAVQSVTILDKTLHNGDNLKADYAAQKLNLYFDAKGTAQGLINDLRGSYTSKNYSYFDVEVKSYQGEVSYVAVYEKDNILSNAISNANNAIQSVDTSGYPYLTHTNNNKFVNIKFNMNKVFSYILTYLTFDSLSTTFKNQMLSYVVSNWVGYTGEVGILRD